MIEVLRPTMKVTGVSPLADLQTVRLELSTANSVATVELLKYLRIINNIIICMHACIWV